MNPLKYVITLIFLKMLVYIHATRMKKQCTAQKEQLQEIFSEVTFVLGSHTFATLTRKAPTPTLISDIH